MTDHAREAAEKLCTGFQSVERFREVIQSAIDAACAERDKRIAALIDAAIWLAANERGTPVPEWVDKAVNDW